MQGFKLILRAGLWCLLMVWTSSVWAEHMPEAAAPNRISQYYNLAMANLTETIQDTTTGEAAYYHYLVKNTGNGLDDIYLSSEVVSSIGGTWTALLVADQATTTTLASPQPLFANGTLSFFVKIIPPSDAIFGNCTVKVKAVNSYFNEHKTGDNLPVGEDADVQQDIIFMQLIPPLLTIATITPSEGSLVSTETLIEAVFNTNPAKWNLNMSLQDESTGINVSGIISLQNNKLSFIPVSHLLASRWYKVSISGLGFVYEWRFKTMVEEDRNEPVPVNGIQDAVNYPNPFNMNTTNEITFGPLPSDDDVVIEIYTLDGELVRTLTSQNGACQWNGRNSDGDKVSSGMYIYIVKMKADKKIGKITIIR